MKEVSYDWKKSLWLIVFLIFGGTAYALSLPVPIPFLTPGEFKINSEDRVQLRTSPNQARHPASVWKELDLRLKIERTVASSS